MGHILDETYNDVIEKLIDTIPEDKCNDVIENCDDADNDTPNFILISFGSFFCISKADDISAEVFNVKEALED